MCVDECGQTGDGALERVQIFILAEGQKFNGIIRYREHFVANFLRESCVYFPINLYVHIV